MESLAHPHISALIVLTTALTGAIYWAIQAIGTDRAVSESGQAAAAKIKLALILIAWYGLVFAAVAYGLLAVGRADYGPPNLIFAVLISAAIGIGVMFRPNFKRVLDATPLAWFLGFHALRVVFGIFFLARFELGTLPAAFAFRGGYGDIAAGILGGLAAFLILLDAPKLVTRTAVVLFSVIGLGDLGLVFYTAATTLPPAGPDDPFNAFLLIPAFAVPLFIITHVYVLRVLARDLGITRAKPESAS